MKPAKNYMAATAILFCCIGLTSCGGGNDNGGAIKVDTVVNPADNTNTQKMDSSLPKGAVGMDTVSGGKASSSGMKDSTRH